MRERQAPLTYRSGPLRKTGCKQSLSASSPLGSSCKFLGTEYCHWCFNALGNKQYHRAVMDCRDLPAEFLPFLRSVFHLFHCDKIPSFYVAFFSLPSILLQGSLIYGFAIKYLTLDKVVLWEGINTVGDDISGLRRKLSLNYLLHLFYWQWRLAWRLLTHFSQLYKLCWCLPPLLGLGFKSFDPHLHLILDLASSLFTTIMLPTQKRAPYNRSQLMMFVLFQNLIY